MKNKVDATSWFLLIFLSLIWGSSFILIKKGLLAFNFLQVGALRILLSAIIVLPFAYSYRKHINKKNIWGIAGTAVFGSGIPPFLFAIAQTQVSSSLAGFINTLTPLFTFLLGFLLYKTAFKKNKLIGLFIGLLGAFVIIILGNQTNQSANAFYAFYIVLATFCYANSVNIIKKYLNTTNPIAITSYSFLLIALPALIILLSTNPIQTFKNESNVWMSFGALVLLSWIGTAFANYLFFHLTQKTNAIFASSVTYLIPIVALFWGMYDGELVNLTQLFGMFLILIGVWVTSKN